MCKRTTGIIVAGLALGGLLLAGSPAGAQSLSHPYNVDQRQDYQQHRIQQGIDSGALTPWEGRHLEREQARIQAAENYMRRDGRLSPWERQRLNQMQNRAGWDINRQKHNGWTSADWNGPHHPGGRPGHPGWQGQHSGWDNGRHNGWNNGNQGQHYGWNAPRHGGWAGPAHHPGYGRQENFQPQRFQPGNYHGGQAGWQGQPRFHQPRPPQMPQPVMRPQAPVMTRQPGGIAAPVSRANFSPPSNGFRRR